MRGDHNQYQKDRSYLDFECPRCGHCCQAKGEEHVSREAIEEAIEVLEDASAEMLTETGDENYYGEAIAVLRQALEVNMSENKSAKTPADGSMAWGCQCGRAYTVTCISSKPPKREWVRLTALEIYECWKTGDVVEAVEAKLKEKNT